MSFIKIYKKNWSLLSLPTPGTLYVGYDSSDTWGHGTDVLLQMDEYGVVTPIGSGSTSGVGTLSGLTDTSIDNLQTGDVIVWNGEVWENTPASLGSNYINAVPVPVTIGGVGAGSTFPSPGKTMQQMWDQLLYPYQYPLFTSFGITSESSTQEIGDGWSDDRTFTWSTSNSSSVLTDSIGITGYNLTPLSSEPNDGSQVGVFTDNVTRDSSAGIGTRSWYINGTNTLSGSMTQRTYSIRWDWKWYWGTSSNTSLTETQIETLTSSGLYSSYSRTFPVSGGDYKYICFADVYGGPIKFMDPLYGFGIAMAGGYAPYTNFDNGLYYAIVSVTNIFGETTNYRVYRTQDTIVDAVDIVVS